MCIHRLKKCTRSATYAAMYWLVAFVLIDILSLAHSYEATDSSATNYRIEHWQVSNAQVIEKGQRVVAEGLPQISVHAIAKDHRGLFWIGTENGIARFDGRKFEIINTINEPELPSNWIDDIFVDEAGQVWIATANGIVNYSGGVFKRISFEKGQDRIMRIEQSSNGELWFFGASLWSANNNELSVPQEFQFVPEKISDGSVDGSMVWVLGADNVLVSHDLSTKKTCRIRLDADSQYTHLHAKSQRLYLLKNNEFHSYRYNSNACALSENLAVSPQKIRALLPRSAGLPILVGENNLLYELGPRDEITQMPMNGAVSPNLINDIITVYQYGDLTLLGTKANGLVLLWPSAISRPAADRPFSDARVWSFNVKDTVYAASNMGVYTLSEQDQWNMIVSQNSLDGNDAYSLFVDDNIIWVGTRNGLYRYSMTTSQTTEVSGFEGYQINTIFEANGRLWLGTNNGLFNQHDGKFIHDPFFSGQSIRSIYRTKSGQLWVGTESGLFSANDIDVFNEIIWKQQFMATVKSAFVSNITESLNGDLFVATYGDGLFYKDKKGKWTQYTTRNGLPFQNLFNLNISANELWVSGASGIFSVNLPDLYNNEVRPNIVLRDDGTFKSRKDVRCCNGAGNYRGVVYEDKIYYPTLAGVLTIDLVERQPLISPVVITGVYQNGARLTSNYSGVNLQSERNLEIAYTKPVFISEEVPQYRYRLSKEEGSWIHAGQRELAYFTNIPSGELVFEVSAKLGNEQWRPTTAIPISVVPYWWETWWARSVMALSIVLLGWLLFSIRTRALIKRNEILEKMVEERTLAYERVNKELEQKNADLKQAANTDPLTGLSNRRAIKEYLPKLFDAINVRQSQVNESDEICALFLIDLDNFKRINDEFGHDKGDSVLSYVADAIESVSREQDCLLRWGGEEFLLIVPSTNKRSFTALSTRLHQALTSLHEKLGLPLPITMSMGAIWLPWLHSQTDFHQWEHSMLLIDLALYRVKDTGRNGTALVHTTPQLSDWLNWSKEGLEKAERQGIITIERLKLK